MLSKLMDIHNHTVWSDGVHWPEEIIENGIANGIEIIGISDHFNTIKCKSVSVTRLSNYIEEIKRLKVKYGGKIQVLSGIEICMNKEWCNLDVLPYEILNKLDYILFEYVDLFSDSVSLKTVREYTDKITCRKGLAHTNIFNLVNKYGLDEVVKILKENELFWEINVNRGYEYFDKIIEKRQTRWIFEVFKRMMECGVEITVGSDTHSLYFYDIERIKVGNQLAKQFTKGV
jgi:histidinol phosphatase-like PHP family hydrolase